MTARATTERAETEQTMTGAAGLLRSSAVIMLGFVLSRLLGVAREVVIGARFGTSGAYDAYVAAFRLPDLLFLLVMSGAFGSAFLPIFVGFWTRGQPERAWRLANAVITLALVVCLALAGISYLLAPWLVPTFVAPGMVGEQLALAVDLTRLLLLSPLLLGLGAAAMGILNARKSFVWPAFAPVAYNLGIIGGALLLGERLGIYGLALGVLAGAGAHFLLQTPGLWQAGMRYRPVLSLRVDGLGEMSRLLGPRVLGQAAVQLNFIILTNLASRLPDGRLGALNYAFLLMMLPHGLFALSLATVIFPTLAEQFKREEISALRETLQAALRLLLFLTVPAAVGLMVLRQPLVQVLFERGAFSHESTLLVSEALLWMAVGLIPVALVEAVTRAFYAVHDTTTPVLGTLATMAVTLGAGLILMPTMGHGGLALAMSLASLGELIVLLVILRRRLGPLLRSLLPTLGRAALGGVVVVALLQPVSAPLATLTAPGSGPALGPALWLATAIGWGVAGYLVVMALTRSPELTSVWEPLARRLGIERLRGS